MNNVTNSASVLDKFAEKIDFTKLEGKPEDFYKAGLAFVENGQFDDGIIEFVKIIKTVSPQESLFVATIKELKSMGFSNADIRAAVGISKVEGETELGVDSQNQGNTELSLTKKNIAASISSGIGIGLAAFVVSVSLLYILAMITIRLLGSGGDAGVMLFVFVLPTIISSVIAVTVGIVAGGKAHKNMKNESRLESPSEQVPLTEHISKEDFSKLTYRQKFAVTEYGHLLSPENAEEVGKILGNFQEKDVLPFCRKNGKEVSFEK